MKTVGEKIKHLREKRGLEAQKLANELNIGKSTLSNWENNRRTPDSETLLKIAKYFNVTVDYLINDCKTEEEMVLTDRQKKLIYTFEAMTEEEQELFFNMMEKFNSK